MAALCLPLAPDARMRFAAAPGTLVIGLMVAAPAWAEANPWWVGADAQVQSDSNVFRLEADDALPAGRSRSDRRLLTTLRAGLDQPIGRQRVYADAALTDARHSRNDELNHRAHRVRAGLDWSTVGRLSGDVTLGTERGLATYGVDDSSEARFERNLRTQQHAGAKVRLGVVTRWTAQAEIDTHRVRYSQDSANRLEFNQRSAFLGMIYSPTGLSRWGVGLRQGQTDYPNYQAQADGSVLADRAKTRHVELRMQLAPGGVSELNARVGVGRTRYDLAQSRDVDGVTGEASWTWRPTGKLTIDTRLQRDRGEEFNLKDATLASQTVDYSRTSNGLSALAVYALSAKIGLTARAATIHRNLIDTKTDATGTPTTREGRDRTQLLSLGARWNPTRAAEFSCEAARESRHASGDLTSDFSVNSFTCRAALMLR